MTKSAKPDGQNFHVLIVGASGLVGSAASNSFLNAGWRVTTASRRHPEWVAGTDFSHVTLDLLDADACQRAALQGDITHIVYTSVFELPGLVQGWSDPQQISTNDQMLRNLLSPVLKHNKVQHLTLLQGTKAYGASVQPMRIPARESQSRVDHPNFYWRQEDYLRQSAAEFGFGFTILRPQLIVGPNYGVVMNLPPVIGAYAAIRKQEGLPFSFPGGADWVWEAVDARLVGNACVWAASAPNALGETFNLTNGEVFSWRDMWPKIAKSLNVATGPDSPLVLSEYLTERAAIWDDVVVQYSLQQKSLAEILGESHHYANLCLNCGNPEPPPATFVSTVKVKQAGFTETMNSEESFCYWLGVLQDAKILPVYET
jgi:nucleoside-diphosphate-sugar epimerase